MIELSHLIYLLTSIAVTAFVAIIERRNGHAFLVEAFDGNAAMANAVGRMRVVGFCLIGIGYAAFALGWGKPPETTVALVESLSTKLGVLLFLLGVFHSINVRVVLNMRRRALAARKEV